MAVIDIRREHHSNIKSAKTAVNRIAKALAKEHGADHSWDGDTLHFKHTGVKGQIAVSKTDLHVRVELGLLMGALKGTIEREIERQLDENIA